MKTIIHSNSDQLRASLLTSAQKDIRYYLCGVCIEATPTYTRLISTDGHRASIQGFKVENTIGKEIQFIVPAYILKLLKSKDTFVIFESDDLINWTMKTLPDTRKSLLFSIETPHDEGTLKVEH